MTLFPIVVKKTRAPGRDRRSRRRIPTGAPRVVESSGDRRARADSDAWEALLDGIRRSAAARLELLRGRPGDDQISCPWNRITGCDADCRCRGTRAVTVDFVRDHCARLATDIALLVRRPS